MLQMVQTLYQTAQAFFMSAPMTSNSSPSAACPVTRTTNAPRLYDRRQQRIWTVSTCGFRKSRT